jgi:hypothetical protein
MANKKIEADRRSAAVLRTAGILGKPTLLVLLVLGMAIISCDPDGNDENGDIVGTWSRDGMTLKFTASTWEWRGEDNGVIGSGPYTYQGTTLEFTVSEQGDTKVSGTATVSSSTLIISGFTGDGATDLNGTWTK